jgi:hypothetical protein
MFSLLLILSVKCILHILELQVLMSVPFTRRKKCTGSQKVTSLPFLALESPCDSSIRMKGGFLFGDGEEWSVEV